MNGKDLNLHPLHYEDLQKSGLSDETIKEAKIFSVPPGQISKIINNASVNSLLAFPYPGTDFLRYKLFPPLKSQDGHTVRYYQPKGSPVRLYFPPDFDFNATTIHITEGEKKALKATQEGLNCIGLGGIWNFAVKDSNGNPRLIEDFNLIELANKQVELVPDADFQTKPEVAHAVYRLGNLLENEGATVSIVCLPKGNKLDDYLCEHSVEEFQQLERISLSHQIFQPAKKKEEKKRKVTAADVLVTLARKNVTTFFTDQYDVAYARYIVQDHFEHHPIKGKFFKSWLQRLFYLATGRAANMEAINQALETIEAIARFGGSGTIELYNRVCMKDGAIYYDLCNEMWQTVRITSEGWEIVTNPPILFRRLAHQQAQVLPKKEGDINDLYSLLDGIKDEESKILVILWLVACFIPDFPHAALVLSGEQGSGKTSLTRMLKTIIDPSKVDTLTLHGETEELIQTLSHHWVAGFDNLSILRKEVQNTFSRAVTGSGFSKRKLYTDEDDVILNLKNCLILNGINYPTTTPDLLDRCLLIGMRRLENSGKIKKENELQRQFQAALPFILGGVFNVLSGAIKIKERINLSNLPRMADWCEWCYAIAEAMGVGGEQFLEAYYSNMDHRNQEIIASNPISEALVTFMNDKLDWQGTPSELLDELELIVNERTRKSKGWPKDVRWLIRRLNILKTNLREAGIEFEVSRSRERRIHLFRFQRPGKSDVDNVDNVETQQYPALSGDINVDIKNDNVADDVEDKYLKSQEFDNIDDSDVKKPLLSGNEKIRQLPFQPPTLEEVLE